MAGVYDLQEHRRCVEAGADDYLVWADPALMPTRIRALLRAKQHQEQERIERIARALGCAVEAKNGAGGAQLQSLSCCAAPC